MNTRALQNVVIFVAGAAVGSLGTYFLVKGRFQKIADDEIESIKQMCADRVYAAEHANGLDEEDDEASTLSTSEARRDYYMRKLNELGYRTAGVSEEEYDDYFLSDEDEDDGVNPVEYPEKPYYISEAEFISENKNSIVDGEMALHYYKKDHVLCDEMFSEISPDVKAEYVGDLLDVFKSPNPEACEIAEYDGPVSELKEIYIRNKDTNTDYEIIIFDEKYEDAVLGETGKDDEDSEAEVSDDVKKRIAD